MQTIKRFAIGLVLFWTATAMAVAQPKPSPEPSGHEGLFRRHLADYDAELRRRDGHVDADAMLSRLKELGVTRYYYLVYHGRNDWDDLKLFLPKASKAGIDVWVYLVPPSESSPSSYSEPFRLDYQRWAEEIAKLSLEYPNLTGWVIDDFCYNLKLYTPDYVRRMQAKAKQINPKLAFLPLLYFNDLRPSFLENYRALIDGVVVAYLRDRPEIDHAWAILNDAVHVPPCELSFPGDRSSHAGDSLAVSQSAKVLPADRYVLRVRELDGYSGKTAGYHFKQVLIDGAVVWEEDVAGGPLDRRELTLDVTPQVRGKTDVTVAFRLLEKKGVGNFPLRWFVSDLHADGLQLAAGLEQPQQWKVARQGAFETSLGKPIQPGQRRFHVPFISMTAADVYEFRLRHGDPATPERIAERLQTSLQAWKDGKCDGVVTYCLAKGQRSQTFPAVQKVFHQFGDAR